MLHFITHVATADPLETGFAVKERFTSKGETDQVKWICEKLQNILVADHFAYYLFGTSVLHLLSYTIWNGAILFSLEPTNYISRILKADGTNI